MQSSFVQDHNHPHNHGSKTLSSTLSSTLFRIIPHCNTSFLQYDKKNKNDNGNIKKRIIVRIKKPHWKTPPNNIGVSSRPDAGIVISNITQSMFSGAYPLSHAMNKKLYASTLHQRITYYSYRHIDMPYFAFPIRSHSFYPRIFINMYLDQYH